MNATLVVSIIKNIVVNVKNTLLNIKNIVLNVKNIVLNIKNTLLIIKNIVLNATEVAEIVENVAVHAASATRHTRTNTVHAGPTPAGPASQGRRAARAETKGTWAPAVALALGVAALALGGCGERQSAVRAAAQAQLRMIGQASTIYAQDHGAAPSIDGLLASGLIDPQTRRGVAHAVLAPAPASAGGEPPIEAPVPWIVQLVPCRAVRAGEAWGGPGETIDHDLPACRFMLWTDGRVEAIDESAFQREWAGRMRLVPLR